MVGPQQTLSHHFPGVEAVQYIEQPDGLERGDPLPGIFVGHVTSGPSFAEGSLVRVRSEPFESAGTWPRSAARLRHQAGGLHCYQVELAGLLFTLEAQSDFKGESCQRVLRILRDLGMPSDHRNFVAGVPPELRSIQERRHGELTKEELEALGRYLDTCLPPPVGGIEGIVRLASCPRLSLSSWRCTRFLDKPPGWKDGDTLAWVPRPASDELKAHGRGCRQAGLPVPQIYLSWENSD